MLIFNYAIQPFVVVTRISSLDLLRLNEISILRAGANRTQVGPMLAPWTLLSGIVYRKILGKHFMFYWSKNEFMTTFHNFKHDYIKKFYWSFDIFHWSSYFLVFHWPWPEDWQDLHSLSRNSHHYNDPIMGAIASQITSLAIVYSDADQRKHQSSASLAFVAGNSLGTGEFPAQMASNAKNISIWWCHHDIGHFITQVIPWWEIDRKF